jgi:hypothetical protein
MGKRGHCHYTGSSNIRKKDRCTYTACCAIKDRSGVAWFRLVTWKFRGMRIVSRGDVFEEGKRRRELICCRNAQKRTGGQRSSVRANRHA